MSGPESSTSRQVKRITKDATTFLTNYARNINSYPNKAEKQTVLKVVQAIPGNEHITVEKLTQWFSRHRNPAHAPTRNHPRLVGAHPTVSTKTPVLVDDETILFPKLTPTHLEHLRALYKKRPTPAEGIVTFWAQRLNADRAEVEAWIQYQQEKAKENEQMSPTSDSPEIPLRQLVGDPAESTSESPTMPDFPRPHLPTPAKSLSPSTSPHTRMLSLPPIAVKEEDQRASLSPLVMFSKPPTLSQQKPVYTEHRSVLDGFPPFRRMTQDSSVSRQQEKPPLVGVELPMSTLHVGEVTSRRFAATASLAASIRDSLRSDNRVDEPPPTTTDEFESRFKKVQDQINVFMKLFDDGKLAPLGWDSSLNKAMLSEI